MTHRMIIAGFGGQGILFASKVLSYAAMLEEKELSWLPSYGPEMRGGTANCNVVISDSPISSPVVSRADSVIVMNLPSLEKFEGNALAGGNIFIDSYLIPSKVGRSDVNAVYCPATGIAEDMGFRNLGNMVMVGRFVKETGVLTLEKVIEGMKKSVPPAKTAVMESNERLIRAGYDA